jgi:hypothetical protein
MAAAVRPRVGYRFSTYDPLSFVAFPDYPHDLPAGKYLKRFPRFTGKLGVSTEDHLDEFFRVMEDFDVEHEDVVMRMFVPTLKEAQAWNKSLPKASIDGWDSFQEKFIERWSDQQDNLAAYKYPSIHEVPSVVEQGIRTFSQGLWEILAILESYDGNNVPYFITSTQIL